MAVRTFFEYGYLCEKRAGYRLMPVRAYRLSYESFNYYRFSDF
ncbi:hypothetical protein CLOSYM_03623 [[Clostridium] symbiosum ATCC 14940]|uniref:Uncharacterized protein n=1 Tax=[Clostridium] symbiosum ATCC 14940 TaxID=411472 RepID=A0ABC9TU64_CLOSY|nr:hypothetical protein CLOSYM_03623 [[Clostridium] symbiosum ATCC 14940]